MVAEVEDEVVDRENRGNGQWVLYIENRPLGKFQSLMSKLVTE